MNSALKKAYATTRSGLKKARSAAKRYNLVKSRGAKSSSGTVSISDHNRRGYSMRTYQGRSRMSHSVNNDRRRTLKYNPYKAKKLGIVMKK